MTELLLTDKVEVAEKGNAHCKKCNKIIQNGEPRLQRYHTTRYGYQPTYICYRCAKIILEEERNTLKSGLVDNKMRMRALRNTIKKCSKTLIANTLMEGSQENKNGN
jgi:hypothetical protein